MSRLGSARQSHGELTFAAMVADRTRSIVLLSPARIGKAAPTELLRTTERSLSSAPAHSDLRLDSLPRTPLGAQCSNPVSIDDYPRSPQLSALRLGIPEPRANALLDECSLELGHRANDLEHEPPRRGAEVKVVSQADECHPECREFG